LFQSVWVQIVDEEPSSHLSSGITREIAGGANEAFDRLLRRYNNVLVQKAAYYLRRIRRYDAFYEAQEAVDDALATMFDRARQGEPLTIQTAVNFWREFFYHIRREIRKVRDYNLAQKRDPKGGSTRSDPHRGREVRYGREMPTAKRPSRFEIELDAFYSQLPSHEDVVVMAMDVDHLITSFSDPICGEILKMRLEGYSTEEIALHLKLSVSTVERRFRDIRRRYSSRTQE
jgi:DNA-directed RNA polymerase specialized sigma24 family protein